MVSFLFIVFIVVCFLEIWIYVGYPFFLFLITFLYQRNYNFSDNYQPTITLIILTYNEEDTIRKKIINSLELEYDKSKLEIIVVDSGSSDKTQSIVKEFDQDQVRLVIQPTRQGKASAVDFGIRNANNEIIIATDANAFFAKNVLKQVTPYFFDTNTGGVTGAMRQLDQSKTTISFSGEFYWKYEKMIRIHESKIHSCISMSGEICCFRRQIFDNVNFHDWYKRSEADDFSLSLFIISKGYRIAYAADALVWEIAPSNKEDFFQQKVRVVVMTICTMMHRFFTNNLKPSFYSILTLPSRKYLPLFSPLFLLIILIVNIFLVFKMQNFITEFLLMIQIMFYLFSLLGFIQIFKRFSTISVTNFFILLNISVIFAWIDYFKSKDYTIWNKVAGTRAIKS